MNPLDCNKPRKLTSKLSKKEISVFHVSSRNSSALNSNKQPTVHHTPHTESTNKTKGKESYEIGSESEIEIYIGGPNAMYKKQDKMTPFMSRLNQEDIIVKTQKKIIDSEKRKAYADKENWDTEPDEAPVTSGQKCENLDQYKFGGDSDTSMDVDFDEMDL